MARRGRRVRRPRDRPLPRRRSATSRSRGRRARRRRSRQGLDRKVPGITPFRTTTDDFYRVDTRLSLPIVDADVLGADHRRRRRPRADSQLRRPARDADDRARHHPHLRLQRHRRPLRRRRPLARRTRSQTCSTGPASAHSADQILSTDVDGMTISTPLALATDGRDAMIAIGMNGEPLPREHGFPARMVVPGLYGFISACKWINRMTLTTYDDHTAYWTDRGWATDAPIKIASRIDTPQGFHRQGRHAPSSAASPGRSPSASRRSRCRSTAAPGSRRTLGPSAGNDYWRQWYLPWDAEPGRTRSLPRHRPATATCRRRPGRCRSRRRQRHPADLGHRRLIRTHPDGHRGAEPPAPNTR